MKISKLHIFLLAMLFLSNIANAQIGFGMRFASDFNHFFRADEYPVVNSGFSNISVGPFFRSYFPNGGFELGTNFIYKSSRDKGMSLPLVTDDFSDNQNTSYMGVELDFKVGPSIGNFRPRFGYTMGYLFENNGFLEDGNDSLEINNFYISLPFGFAFDWKTGFGTVGAGLYYKIGMLNVIKKPEAVQNNDIYNGSKWRSLTFEITVMFSKE